MSKHNDFVSDTTSSYRIGAVARLTGISVDRLRAWERRYGVVETRRTEALGRIYTRSDVDRLLLIKQLVDLGNPIGSVARLSDAQLHERLQQDARSGSPPPDPFARQPVSVAACGPTIGALLKGALPQLQGIQLVGTFDNPQALRDHPPRATVEVVIAEYPGVHEETATDVRALLEATAASRAVLVCGFGRKEHLAALREMGALVLRSPVSIEELELACRFRGEAGSDSDDTIGAVLEMHPNEDDIPPRRFADTDLLQLASLSRSVACECPEHLITLIGSLSAFEVYSATCKNRNPDDAALHAYLHRITAQARALIEEALENVAEMEGLTR